MKRVLSFLNPIEHLGDREYSFFFPLLTTLAAIGLLEAWSIYIVRDPNAVGIFAIFIFIALIIYFSFREGIRGGFITASLTIGYYFYIISSRNYTGQQLRSGIETTAILAVLYYFLAYVIGWLKQTIDSLIDKEANEKNRLRSIIQQLPVGVLITDEKGKLVMSNKQVEMILGKKIREGMLAGKNAIASGKRYTKPMAPAQWPLAQTFATGKPITGKEYVIQREDGRRKYVQISASLIHSREGKVIAAASIINDVTQQKELEERKDDFVNMASHELKTPITSMKLYLDAVSTQLKPHNDPKLHKMMKAIKDQTEKLQALVSDLLDVSRLQTGKLTFTKEEFNLDKLMQETINGLKSSTKKQKIVYTRNAPLTVIGDRFRIYQVLSNLITNAVKYSPEGTEILVKMKKEGKRAVVSVQDHGIGIPKEQQKKIFERLYQVTDSKEKSFPGLGMGLYIAKAIVKKHKGDIWVESTEGKGSTFYFSLPLSK